MAKAAEKLILPDHKNRYVRFLPTITTGNIITAVAILVSAVTAWVQLNNQVGSLALATKATADTLAIENTARKSEIKEAMTQQENDRDNLYKKIEADHVETMADIKAAQQNTHDDVKELASAVGGRFDRLEDKIDKKADKKP